jgi:xanthine dehydrogenase iron-sulfur cluster and FAD-binding subunit A
MDRQPEVQVKTNSHLLAHGFDYLEAASVEDAVALLARYEGRARVMAGGTDLVVMMKMERHKPAAVVNISKIPGLNQIEPDAKAGVLRIGALASIHTLALHPLIQSQFPCLAEACSAFGSTQVEVMGTIGGNLCNGSPAGDTAPALLVLCAQLVLVGPQGRRIVPVEEFFIGPGKTVLQPGELLVEVDLPLAAEPSASVFLKVARVAADLAKASLAIHLSRQGDRITGVRLAMGAVAPKPIRLPAAEAVLLGKPFTPELAAEAGLAASQEITPIDDLRSTARYRRQIANAMVQDGLAAAWERAAQGRVLHTPDLPASHPLPSNGHHTPLPIGELKAGERHEIETRVNGRSVKLWVTSNDLLLNVLREQLELTGTKYACGIGECSACTVQIDGKPSLSCLVLAASVAGKAVTTIEGLQDPASGALDPLQAAFIAETAFQCGYCTPGVLMTAKSLLREVPQPSEQQVRHYLRGNNCRCTGYASIVRAVLSAAQPLDGSD